MQLNRRAVLAGSGAAIAAPWLASCATGAEPPPVRAIDYTDLHRFN
ncbi:MAG: hypothetical protein AB7J28_04680 [Hyphomonadaceae bacterium]